MTVVLLALTLIRRCSKLTWTWFCSPRRRISGPRISMPRLTPRSTAFSRSRAPSTPRASGPSSQPARRPRLTTSAWYLGTLWRHDRPHRETYNRVSHGAIGQILGARSRYNVGQLWYAPRKKGWSDMEAMIRDWVNWRWLSGDHIVEQFVHNLNTVLWFAGMAPTSAIGDGGRVQRVTGDQYDHFHIEFTYPNGGINDSMCRQIDGCANDVSDYIVGTEGCTNCKDTIFDLSGNVVWKYQEAGQDPGKTKFNPYDQEHVDFVNAIRTNQPVNEAEHLAHSTLIGILGRTAAYTGKEVKWDEMMDSNERLGPTEYAMGPVPIKAEIPVPGNAANIAKNARTA